MSSCPFYVLSVTKLASQSRQPHSHVEEIWMLQIVGVICNWYIVDVFFLLVKVERRSAVLRIPCLFFRNKGLWKYRGANNPNTAQRRRCSMPLAKCRQTVLTLRRHCRIGLYGMCRTCRHGSASGGSDGMSSCSDSWR